MPAARFALAAVLAWAGLAAADPQQVVTAEAVAAAAVKPDRAKVYLHCESKAGDAGSAAETNGTARKELLAAVDKLALKNVTVAVQPQRLTKDRDNSNQFGRVVVGPGGAPNQPPADTYTAGQTVLCTVADADPDKLHAAVERITVAAAGMGVTGDKGVNDTGFYSPYANTRNGAKVVYTSKAWEPSLADALTNATGAAMRRAEALAKGAGLKVMNVVSVEEVGEVAGKDAESNPLTARIVMAAAASQPADDELVDGELVRKVRVRVKVTVGK